MCGVELYDVWCDVWCCVMWCAVLIKEDRP
jgi:hypothetical protein